MCRIGGLDHWSVATDNINCRTLKVSLLPISEATWEVLTYGRMRMMSMTLTFLNPCMTRSWKLLASQECYISEGYMYGIRLTLI
jgi:hypothetical protein